MIPMLILSTLLAALLAASIVALRFLRLRSRHAASEKKIDGVPMVPNPHWYFGHFQTFFSRAGFDANQRALCLDHANSEGMCTFRLFGLTVLSVTRPADAKKILTAAQNRRPGYLQRRHSRRFLGRRSIVQLTGREWRYYRSAMHRAFTPAALAGMQRPMTEVPATLVASLQRKMLDGDGASVTVTMDVEPLLKMVTMDTFGKSALGLDFGCCTDLAPSPVATAFDFLSEELMRRFRTFYRPASHFYVLPTAANRRHRRESRLIRGVLEGAIRDRMRSGEEGGSAECSALEDDLLSHLLRAKANEGDVLGSNGKKLVESTRFEDLSEETFSDILMTLLFAGYETTSITLTYALYCLATNPTAEGALVEEVNRVLGPTSSSEEQQQLDPETLPYCRAVILETLRLYPPATNTTRTLESDLKVGDHIIPAGTMAFIPIWLIHRDGRNYPRPLEFVPERWVGRDGKGCGWRERYPGEDADGSPAAAATTTTSIPAASREAFFAFSGGARSCVGRKFAMQEAVTALAVLVRDLKFECVEGYVLEPHRPGIVQKPKNGMPMRISRRGGS